MLPENAVNGPYWLARLLAGLPVDESVLAGLAYPWDSLAAHLKNTPAANRVEQLNALLADRLDAEHIRRAIFATDPLAPEPAAPVPSLAFADTPPLPGAAGLAIESTGIWKNHWVADYIDFASQAAPMSDRAFHQSCALFLLSTAVARRVYLPAGAHHIFPNLYQLIVAPSTVHHKTTALQLAGQVMKKAAVDLMLLAPRQTPESLVSEMSTIRPPTYTAWPSEEQARWLQERAFAAQRGWLIDEASQLLESFNRDYTAGLLPLVLALYDCPEREASQTIGRGRQAIQNAYLSLLGATTPAALAHHLQRNGHWSNGLWARFALVTPVQPVPVWQFLPQHIQAPAHLAQRLGRLAFQALRAPAVREAAEKIQVETLNALPVFAPPVVYQAWETYARALSYDLLISGQVDNRLWPTYGRLHISAMKVALLLAVMDWSDQGEWSSTPQINLQHWGAAQAIAESWRASTHRILADASRGEEQTHEERVLRVLANASPQGFTAREVCQRVHMGRSRVNEILSGLARDGLVWQVRAEGQKADRYLLPAGGVS